MLIESKIRREKETPITMRSGKVYTFGPRAGDDRHVCEVEHDDDIGDFLAIKEGYRIAKGDAEKPNSIPMATSAPTSGFTQEPTSAPSAAPVPLVSEATGAPTSIATDPPDVDAMSKAELIDHAKANGISVNESLPKPAILSTVKAATDGR